MDKKKILLCNEASYLSTGFATYGLEVMQRLYKTGKYELAELASYGGTEANEENRHHQLPWKYYPNLPQNDRENEIYKAKPTNQWGEWNFDKVALDFKPDIVWDIRDWWMLEHQERSPFRNYYHWAIMPTVDSAPQDDHWIATYLNANGVFTYSDWGFDQLKNCKVNVKGTASPGINFDNYKVPEDKGKHKQEFGLPPNIFVVGTVMRNQRRKLYPDLIEAFALFLKEAPPELSSKTYLYLHCAYPDIAWNIPKLIKEAGISSKVIFTYFCQNCSHVFASFYQDVIGSCPHCRQNKAILPRSQMGVSGEILGKILGLFDAYVQYATCEGFGMPQVEAAACGVPVFSVDYSAMSDVVRKLKGYPIAVKRMFRECETHTYKALPDNEDLVKKLIEFLSLPEPMRLRRGREAAINAHANYNWDATAKVWENYFDEVSTVPQTHTWLSPAKIFNPKSLPPDNLSNQEFVAWCFANILGRPDLTNSFLANKILRDLNWGVCQVGVDNSYFNDLSALGIQNISKEFNRGDVLKLFYQLNQTYNFWEEQREKSKRYGTNS